LICKLLPTLILLSGVGTCFHHVVIKIWQLFLRPAVCLTSTLLETRVGANDCKCNRDQRLNVPFEARRVSLIEVNHELVKFFLHFSFLHQTITRAGHNESMRDRCMHTAYALHIIIIIIISLLMSPQGTGVPYGLTTRRTGHNPPHGPSAGWRCISVE
jgi:hypothetical protein